MHKYIKKNSPYGKYLLKTEYNWWSVRSAWQNMVLLGDRNYATTGGIEAEDIQLYTHHSAKSPINLTITAKG